MSKGNGKNMGKNGLVEISLIMASITTEELEEVPGSIWEKFEALARGVLVFAGRTDGNIAFGIKNALVVAYVMGQRDAIIIPD